MIIDQTIVKYLKKIQSVITEFLEENNSPLTKEDLWNYNKGSGGGITRVWDNSGWIEKAGVNFSCIEGVHLPNSSLSSSPHGDKKKPFMATGVSLVIHPHNPFVPTIHMNIRYFKTEDTYWFGGGIDLTPTYPKKKQIIHFHKQLQSICEKNHQNYPLFKQQCDNYFFLPHRKEARGVGGIFFDHLKENTQQTFEFIKDLGFYFPNFYQPFINNNQENSFSTKQKEFQELRRSRYVEFNLLYDRGTHFGLQSDGRIESILISMPKIARWQYEDNFIKNSPEQELLDFYLQPQDWVNL